MSCTILSLEDLAGSCMAETFLVGKEYLIIPGTAVTHKVNGVSQHGRLGVASGLFTSWCPG